MAAAVFAGGSAAAAAARSDGLLLTGGGDADPALYGENPLPACHPPDRRRDEEELALIAAFTARGKPILGICRGLQLLAVAFGGTLCQDLPGHAGGVLHTVTVSPGSRLRGLVGPALLVNSYHHQAVRSPGALRVCAQAVDGTIEAAEHPYLPVLGVQWHPERLVRGVCTDSPCELRPLFDGLRRAL